MPTTVVSTISLSGTPDYSTLQAWEDAAPADLVAADIIWKGVIQSKSDNFSGTGVMLLVAGSTTDATHYKELTVADGASFVDNNADSALRYDEAKGASVTSSVNTWTINSDEGYFRISRLQVQNTDPGGQGGAIENWVNGGLIDQCIAESRANWSTVNISNNGLLSNSLVVCKNSGATNIMICNGTGRMLNTTLAVPSDLTPATNAVRASNTGQDIKNCAFFGVTNVHSIGTPTYTTCFTDAVTPPAGCITTNYSTNSGAFFENITDAAYDYRIKSSSVLRDAGTDDASNAANDIFGTPRITGAYDVGCWEFTLSGSASALSTASGDLATAIPFEGTSIVVSTATGSLNVPVDLAAVASAKASASGDLTTSITLSGAAVSASLANAGIDTSILMTADASAESSSAGALNAQMQLSANAVAQVLAAAGLSSEIPLGGDAVGASTATGELSSINVPLASDATAVVTGSGDLNAQVKLDGAAVNAVSGSGSLTASVQLSGDVAALVLAGADLTAQISLNAAALSQALASAELSGGVIGIKSNPRYSVFAGWRNYNVAA